jgi:hypothetical protein
MRNGVRNPVGLACGAAGMESMAACQWRWMTVAVCPTILELQQCPHDDERKSCSSLRSYPFPNTRVTYSMALGKPICPYRKVLSRTISFSIDTCVKQIHRKEADSDHTPSDVLGIRVAVHPFAGIQR